MSYHTDHSDGIEHYRIRDADAGLFVRLTYFKPEQTPQYPYGTWVVDFANGDRLTGTPAEEVTKRLLKDPGTSGAGTSRFGEQADSMLDTVVYNETTDRFRITIRGVRVWFRAAKDDGNDVVLYSKPTPSGTAGVIEDPPFTASELTSACDLAEQQEDKHV